MRWLGVGHCSQRNSLDTFSSRSVRPACFLSFMEQSALQYVFSPVCAARPQALNCLDAPCESDPACVGEERFKASANQDRVAELELLMNYLKGAVQKLDSAVEGKVAPLERMKKLLTSKDKKATLLEMAGGLHYCRFSICIDANLSHGIMALEIAREGLVCF